MIITSLPHAETQTHNHETVLFAKVLPVRSNKSFKFSIAIKLPKFKALGLCTEWLDFS